MHGFKWLFYATHNSVSQKLGKGLTQQFLLEAFYVFAIWCQWDLESPEDFTGLNIQRGSLTKLAVDLVVSQQLSWCVGGSTYMWTLLHGSLKMVILLYMEV